MTNPITMKEIHADLLHLRKFANVATLDGLIARVAENVSLLEHLNPDWELLKKPILSVDFDGVISTFKSGIWNINFIPDGPTPFAFQFLANAVKRFHVRIFSTRCNEPAGIAAMMHWFTQHSLPMDVLNQLVFTPGKPSFHLHIDDRAYQYRGGRFPLIHSVVDFRPWYYYNPEWNRSKE